MGDKYWKSLSVVLKKEIKERGITKKELADRAGLVAPTITQIINGDNKNPTIKVLVALAEGLDVPISYLLGEKMEHAHGIEECYRRLGESLKRDRYPKSESFDLPLSPENAARARDFLLEFLSAVSADERHEIYQDVSRIMADLKKNRGAG